MADNAFQSGGSSLLLDEHFAAGDDAFLNELLKITDPRKLAGFADRWKVDPRPWAREKIFDYLEKGLVVPGHNVVVKRLFKQAEKQHDHGLMAAFLHVFDCLVRRQRKMKWRWDRMTRQASQDEILVTPKDNLRPFKTRSGRNPMTGEVMNVLARLPKSGKLFSYRTRFYVRRRAWRYFRFLGYHTPSDYPAAIVAALARYTDEDLAKGEYILDSWCLLNICFRKHSALTFTPSHVHLNDGRTLNELSPAPKLLTTWTTPTGGSALWSLLANAQARFVRLWAIALLKEHHQDFLATLSPAQLLPLFDSLDQDTQQFASELLENMPALGTLPITTWLQLLATKDPTALSNICSQMIRHVTAERLDLAQTVKLANAAPTPVANMGFHFLKTRAIVTPADRESISELANARCEAVAPDIAAYALSILGANPNYDVALISRFFDSLSSPIRTSAWAWLTPESAGYNDPALWARLVETPYEDVRLELVKALQGRIKIPGLSPDQLAPIWSAVLLGIHRGGRHKIAALNQISRALIANPDHAEKLLPIMAVAIRSVRPAEARVGLAAVAQSIERHPSLATAAASAISELRFISAGATA